MSRACSICSHVQRHAIDKALVTRESAIRRIASQHGVVETSLRRHQREHLPQLLARAYAAEESARADDLLREVKALRAKAYSLLLRAEKSGDLRTALAGVREARGCLELFAELEGQLNRQPQITLTTSPEWLEVRTLLLDALKPFPPARAAVAERLLRLQVV